MLERVKSRRSWILVGVTTIAFMVLLSCSEIEQKQLQTAAAQVAQTAAAEAQRFAETQAAQLQETAVAGLATQLARLATQLSQTTPSPWDTSWLPSDTQLVASRIDTILEGSGLSGQGNTILQYAQEYGVNPAFALAMFRKEATFAAPGTPANSNSNPGNIIATGNCRGLPASSSCSGSYGEIGTDGRFGVYPSMADGIRAYFMLLNAEYKPGTTHNCHDIACIITVYCPPSNCDTSAYITQVTEWTREYQGRLLTP